MKLKDMKISAEELEARNAPKGIDMPSTYAQGRYPWGLEIRLDTEALEKLGIDKMPTVGKRIRIEAVCAVKSARVEEQMRDGKKAPPSRTLELQIQKLGFSSDPQSAGDAIDDALDDVG